MTDIIIRDAMILTLDARERLIDEGYIHVSGSRIVSVGSGRPAFDISSMRVIEGRGRLVSPGLINAHSHSQSSTMAGFGDRLSHPAFMWLTQAHTSRRTADEIRLAVFLSAYGMLTSGTTATIDHFPGQRFTSSDMDAVLGAWEETGMRAGVAMRFFDGEFSDIFPSSGLPDDVARKMSEVGVLKPHPLGELEPLMEDTIQRWHGRSARLTVMPAPSNPERCTDAALLACARLAEQYDTGIHTHLLETAKQAKLAKLLYGETAPRHLEKLGVLSDRWSCAHCVWLEDSDMELMAERGAIAVLNPESNARIGAGRARAPAMLKYGMRLALGTDGAGANDNQVMHEAMRSVATEHRATESDRHQWISGRAALGMATTGGAAVLRQTSLGMISPGFVADLVLYRLDAPWWVPVNDPVNQLVFAETGAMVDSVIVDGRVVLDRGRVVTFDVDAMIGEVRAMVRSLRARNSDLFDVAGAIAAIIP